MKNKFLNKRSFVVILSLLMVSLTGCESEWIDSDLNIDPDSPGNVPMSLILPAVEQTIGYSLLGNDNVRTTNIWTQHFDGVARQSYTEARYQLLSADVNNVWDATYGALMNLHTIVEKSKQEGSEAPHFRGVAQVLQATTLGITTDLFGDIPFSNALGGNQNNLRPEYDTQEQVYDTIFDLLENSRGNLRSTENVIPVSGDVIFNNDLDKWIKASYSIEARHYLQLSNVLGDEAYRQALAAAENGFESVADDMAVPFEDSNRNPIFQFMEQRGDIRMGSTLVDLLLENDDPRLPFYVSENAEGELVGSIPGSENETASAPGTYVAGPDSPAVIMTYSELKFIEAEAHLMLGDPEQAQEAYEEAVAASIRRVTGEDNEEWLEANITGGQITLEDIITQKYIATFGTNRPYADYRRTGFPNLELAEGAVISQIPVRFPYPQSELDYNSENVPATRQLTDNLWWDQ